jgi:hypothetical protein
MSVNPASFLEAFRRAEGVNRAGLICDLLLPLPDSFRPLVAVCAARSTDQEQFVRGLQDVLLRQPNNLSALRALAWHHTRRREFARTREVIETMLLHRPTTRNLRRELLRLEIIEPTGRGGATRDLARPELRSAIARLSYQAQFRLGRGFRPGEHDRDALRREVDVSTAGIFRSLEDGGPHRANRGVAFEIHDMILGARRIALVGNGPSLQGAALGDDIDGHDIVIRCNFPKLKSHAPDVGTRTDIVFFNESLVGQLPALRALEPDYAGVRALGFHPDPGLLFDPPTYAHNLQGNTALVPSAMREFIRGFSYETATTGLMGIIYIAVILGRGINLYGFDFYSSDKVHYFASASPVFLGHETDYERWFINTFLNWYDPHACRNADGKEAASS